MVYPKGLSTYLVHTREALKGAFIFASRRYLDCLGTIDFVRGLDLINLPPGVTESCDENDVIAYEVDKSAVVVVNFHNVIDKGHWKQLNLSYNATGVWPGNFSVGMRLRLWEDHADILNIYDSEIGHRFGISIGEEGVFLKFNGVTPAVQISSTNMVDWRFHRILLHFQGNRLLSRVSGPDVEDCGREVISELEFEERDREIPIHRSLVVLGREGDSAIEVSK